MHWIPNSCDLEDNFLIIDYNPKQVRSREILTNIRYTSKIYED